MSDQHRGPVRPSSQPDGTVEYHVSGIEGWDDFEALVEFIVRKFSAKIIDRLDGICSRTWTLRAGELDFIMKHHDDIGNFFFVSEPSSEKERLLKAIADALNAQLLKE